MIIVLRIQKNRSTRTKFIERKPLSTNRRHRQTHNIMRPHVYNKTCKGLYNECPHTRLISISCTINGRFLLSISEIEHRMRSKLYDKLPTVNFLFILQQHSSSICIRSLYISVCYIPGSVHSIWILRIDDCW